MNDYDKQAQDFLAKFGIKFRATLSDSKTPAWADGKPHGHHYRVTLSKSEGKTFVPKFRKIINPSLRSGKEPMVSGGVHFTKSGALKEVKATDAKWFEFVTIEETTRREASRLTFDFWGSVADMEQLAKATKALNDYNRRQNVLAASANRSAGKPGTRRPDSDSLQCAVRRGLEKQIQEAQVSAYDVLACISSDVNCPDSFEDYCSEFGESVDSIRALQTFRRCSRFSSRLKQFFTDEEITALQEIQ